MCSEHSSVTESESTDRIPDPRWLPWVLGIAAALIYAFTGQRQLFNDGIFFEQMLRLGGD